MSRFLKFLSLEIVPQVPDYMSFYCFQLMAVLLFSVLRRELMFNKLKNDFLKFPNQIATSKEVSPKSKVVLLALSRFSPSFPSYTKLQDCTGYSRSTISQAIKELEVLCIITKIKGSSFQAMNNNYKATSEENWQLVQKSHHTSSKTELDVVQKSNSNKTKVIKQNNKEDLLHRLNLQELGINNE